MIELITIFQTSQSWYLNKIFVNSNHMVSIIEDLEHYKLMKEGKIDLPLDNNVRFSKVKMNPATGFDQLIVVGSPSVIMEKINKNTKQLLKG